MSFRERGAWINLTTTVTVYGVYFAYASVRVARGASGGGLFAPLLATVVCLAVLQIVLNIISGIAAPREAGSPPDERERIIDLEATRVAFHVLQTGVFLAFCGLLLAPSQPWLVANGVVMVMVVGEAARAAFQVIGYRRLAA
jgi:hypothetical protein